jgi:hypothetical protein
MVLAGRGGGGWQVEVVIVVVVGHSGGGGADLNLFIRQTSTFIDLRPTGFTSDWVVPQSRRIVLGSCDGSRSDCGATVAPCHFWPVADDSHATLFLCKQSNCVSSTFRLASGRSLVDACSSRWHRNQLSIARYQQQFHPTHVFFACPYSI